MQQFAQNFNLLSTDEDYEVDLAAEGFVPIGQEEFEAHHAGAPLAPPSIEQVDAEAAGYADAAKPRHALTTFAELDKLSEECRAVAKLAVKGISDLRERQRTKAEAWRPRSEAIVADIRAVELGEASGFLVGEVLGRVRRGRRLLAIKAPLRAAISSLRRNSQPIDTALMMLFGMLADNDLGECSISLDRIARVFGRSRQGVSDAMTRIRRGGRFEIEARPNGTYLVRPRAIPADFYYHGLDLVTAFEGQSTTGGAVGDDLKRAGRGKFAAKGVRDAAAIASVCSSKVGAEFSAPEAADFSAPTSLEETSLDHTQETEAYGRGVRQGVRRAREGEKRGTERAANENVGTTRSVKPEPTTWTSEVQAKAIKLTRYVNRKTLRANFEAYVMAGTGSFRQWIKGLHRADERFFREAAANLVTVEATEAFCKWERNRELRFLTGRGQAQKRLPDCTMKKAIADFLKSEAGAQFPLHRLMMPKFSGGCAKLSNEVLSLLGGRLSDLQGEEMVEKAQAILGPDLERKARLSTFLASKQVPKHVVAPDFEWSFQRDEADPADRELVNRIAAHFGIPEHAPDLAWFASRIRCCDDRLLANGARWSADLVATLLFSAAWQIDPAIRPTANAIARLGQKTLAEAGFVFSEMAAA